MLQPDVTATPPLKGLRLVATLPPRHWFGGLDRIAATEMIRELRDLGATVFDLDTSGFVDKDPARIDDAVRAVRQFRADVAMAVPNAGYAFVCRTSKGKNLFRDILRIPTVLIWDHGLLQFAPLVLGSLPVTPAESRDGSIGRLRKGLDHPLFVHYSPDRGMTAVIEKLGVIGAGKVRNFVQPAWPMYVRQARDPQAGPALRSRVAFTGNIYLEAAQKLPFRTHPVLAGIESRMVQAKKAQLTTNLWDLLLAEIEGLDDTTRQELHLHPDDSFFWSFVYGEIETVGTTEARLAVLTGLREECDFYGNFIEPAATSRFQSEFGLRFRGSLDIVTELPFLYQNSDLIVDIVHPGYMSGSSPKIPAVMVCGGMVLFDYKEDFRLAMGEIADSVMYRSVDQLNALIDLYLGDPRKRREIAGELQQRVLREFTIGAFFKHILVDEPAWRSCRGGRFSWLRHL
jgi:hypothetical protein